MQPMTNVSADRDAEKTGGGSDQRNSWGIFPRTIKGSMSSDWREPECTVQLMKEDPNLVIPSWISNIRTTGIF